MPAVPKPPARLSAAAAAAAACRKNYYVADVLASCSIHKTIIITALSLFIILNYSRMVVVNYVRISSVCFV